MVHLIKLIAFCSVLCLIACDSSPKSAMNSKVQNTFPVDSSKKQRYVILLGASIGRGWNIPYLPQRIHGSNYFFEYIGGGSFDKSDRLREIFTRRENKPDAIFIKECAAYFPGDFNLYKKLMVQWIQNCHEHNIVPIPATVVPVTRLHSFKKMMIDLIKLRNPLKYGNPFKHRRNAAILEYNDWIRMYCRANGLSFLDLEAAVRYNIKNRFLKENLAGVDGLHLNRKAYQILDHIVIPTLETVNWEWKRRD